MTLRELREHVEYLIRITGAEQEVKIGPPGHEEAIDRIVIQEHNVKLESV